MGFSRGGGVICLLLPAAVWTAGCGGHARPDARRIEPYEPTGDGRIARVGRILKGHRMNELLDPDPGRSPRICSPSQPAAPPAPGGAPGAATLEAAARRLFDDISAAKPLVESASLGGSEASKALGELEAVAARMRESAAEMARIVEDGLPAPEVGSDLMDCATAMTSGEPPPARAAVPEETTAAASPPAGTSGTAAAPPAEGVAPEEARRRQEAEAEVARNRELLDRLEPVRANASRVWAGCVRRRPAAVAEAWDALLDSCSKDIPELTPLVAKLTARK